MSIRYKYKFFIFVIKMRRGYKIMESQSLFPTLAWNSMIDCIPSQNRTNDGGWPCWPLEKDLLTYAYSMHGWTIFSSSKNGWHPWSISSGSTWSHPCISVPSFWFHTSFYCSISRVDEKDSALEIPATVSVSLTTIIFFYFWRTR